MQHYLLISIEFGPRIIERQMKNLTPDQVDKALHPDRFTPREIVAHLLDWEPIMRERISTMLTNPNYTFVMDDEGDRAVRLDYKSWDVSESLGKWKAERHETANLLRSIGKDDWPKTAIHPEYGVRTVDDQANMLIAHDMYHIEQLSEYLA